MQHSQESCQNQRPIKRQKQMSILDYVTQSPRQLSVERMNNKGDDSNINVNDLRQSLSVPSSSKQTSDDIVFESFTKNENPQINDNECQMLIHFEESKCSSSFSREYVNMNNNDDESTVWSNMTNISDVLFDTDINSTSETIDSDMNRSPECCLPLTPLMPNSNRIILFRVPLSHDSIPLPYPSSYRDYWNWDYVKMPCSECNQIISVKIVDGNKVTNRVSKWKIIENNLIDNIMSIKSSYDLEDAIKMYNPNMENLNFVVLHRLFNFERDESETTNFFHNILPQLIQYAMQLPSIVTQSVPLLKQKRNVTLFLSQYQIGCLLANAFFSTFPKRNGVSTEYINFPDINFKRLFTADDDVVTEIKIEKLNCIINYFRRILKEKPKGVISFERRFLTKDERPNWINSKKSVNKMQVLSKGVIEKEGFGMLQVDFANKFIGGGILGSGCVQEEIRFAICPELIVSRLFTEKLLDNEVLIITGCEQFNTYSGYANTFKWNGDYVDTTVVDEWSRRCTKIVAMDALYFNYEIRHCQYQMELIDRELLKSYCAFFERRQLHPKNKSAIASGNWGCGAFNGDPKLKAIIQLMAASECERSLAFFTFGDEHLKAEIENFYHFLKSNRFTNGHLYKSLRMFDNHIERIALKNQQKIDIFKFIYDSKDLILNA